MPRMSGIRQRRMDEMPSGKVPIGANVFSASNVATWYGCGYNTPLALYNKYKGINIPDEPSAAAQESMKFGTFFEDAVAKYFAQEMGFKIRKCGETAFWAEDMPYFICHPDRLVIGRDNQKRRVALEIKCVSPFSEGWGESGTTEIPDNYYFQVQSYFACDVPCDVVYVVCMRGNRISSYEILPDEEVIADIRYRVAKAKADFDADIVPEPESYSEAVSVYGRKVRMDDDGVGANDEVLGLYNKLIQIHYEQSELENQEENLKKSLMEALGENPAFVITDGKKIKRICYWSQTTTNRLDKDRLVKAHPEINLENFYNQSITRKFNVSFPKAKKEA